MISGESMRLLTGCFADIKKVFWSSLIAAMAYLPSHSWCLCSSDTSATYAFSILADTNTSCLPMPSLKKSS